MGQATRRTACRRLRLRRLVHSARLDVWPAGPALQPRDLITLRGNRPTQLRYLLQQLQHQALEFGSAKAVDVRARRHSQIESEAHRFGNRSRSPRVIPSHPKSKSQTNPRQDFCPSYTCPHPTTGRPIRLYLRTARLERWNAA